MDINKPEYTKKDMWWAISKTSVATFVLAGIFFRFIAVENNQIEILTKMEEDKVEILSKIDYTNERVDKKTARVQEDVDKNSDRIDILEIPNTDNNTD